MYLHINKNCVIKRKDIIGIFSLSIIDNKKSYNNLIENMGKNIIDLSNGNKKTIIFTNENGVNRGYFINLTIFTIEKRIQERI